MRQEVIERISRSVGLPPGSDAIAMLPAILLAWSDGSIDEREVEAIQKRAEALGLAPDARAAVDALLANHPGPYFRHRILHLLNAVRDRVPAEDRVHWAHDLARSAEIVAQAKGPIARLFGLSAKEKEDLAYLVKALERDHPAEIDEGLDRLITVSALRVAGLPALVAKNVTVDKTVHFEMYPEGTLQAFAIRVHVPGWENLVVACIEQFATGDALSSDEVGEILWGTAHRPANERWVSLRQALASHTRPLPPEDHARLLWILRTEDAKAHLHEATLPEFADLEDQLAQNVGWMTWLAGQVPELSLDRERARRLLTPGTVDLFRGQVSDVRVVRPEEPLVEGLSFAVLEIESEGQVEFRLATPELTTGEPTRAACDWIAETLPALRDPRSVVILDDRGDKPVVAVEWREEVVDHPPDPPVVDSLPAGHTLVAPPWAWLRAAWALGVDPGMR